jgi:hypothetical protein
MNSLSLRLPLAPIKQTFGKANNNDTDVTKPMEQWHSEADNRSHGRQMFLPFMELEGVEEVKRVD